MRQREKIRAAIRARRQVVSNDFGELLVMRRGRAVRITAVTKQARFGGKPCAASFGFVDLDDMAVDRLIRRLTTIRGGKRSLPVTDREVR